MRGLGKGIGTRITQVSSATVGTIAGFAATAAAPEIAYIATAVAGTYAAIKLAAPKITRWFGRDNLSADRAAGIEFSEYADLQPSKSPSLFSNALTISLGGAMVGAFMGNALNYGEMRQAKAPAPVPSITQPFTDAAAVIPTGKEKILTCENGRLPKVSYAAGKPELTVTCPK